MFQDLFPFIFLILNTTFHEGENRKKHESKRNLITKIFFWGGSIHIVPPLATALDIAPNVSGEFNVNSLTTIRVLM
jgi:hypothetical protein